MESKRRTCKICNRAFANGKAMGGHMRSHFAKHPIEKSPISSSSSSQISPPEKSDLADRESDTESAPNYSNNNQLPRRRSKRRRKSAVNYAVQVKVQVEVRRSESVSSVSEANFPDEEVAMCLLMLKTDKWSDKSEKKKVKSRRVINLDDDDGGENDSISMSRYIPSPQSHKKLYKCGTCHKRFRSYQALGGHKASHKSAKKHNPDPDEDQEGDAFVSNADVYLKQRIFECSFCDKVFDSGQALGGHKKVHFSYLSTTSTTMVKKRDVAEKSGNFLDLNLPPEEDDEDYGDDEVSQASRADFSVASKAYTLHGKGNV